MEIPTYRPPGSPLAKAFGESSGYGRPLYESATAPWEPGARSLRLVSKAAGAATGDVAAMRVLKSRPEARFVLGLAYPADRPDVGRALDGHRDVASADVVEAAAHNWMRKSLKAGLWHKSGTTGRVQVVESYIYRNPTPWVTTDVAGRHAVIRKGDWIVGAILDEEAWAAAKAGAIDGFSPQGSATRGTLSAERRAQLRRN